MMCATNYQPLVCQHDTPTDYGLPTPCGNSTGYSRPVVNQCWYKARENVRANHHIWRDAHAQYIDGLPNGTPHVNVREYKALQSIACVRHSEGEPIRRLDAVRRGYCRQHG